MTPINKDELLNEVMARLEKQFQLLVEAANEAKEYSTNEESKAENKYDTRGLEASYLASGQSKRAQEIQEQIFNLKKVTVKNFSEQDAIGVSALIKVLVNDKMEKSLFILPVGGVELLKKGEKIQTITLESPIGKQVLGQKVGFDFEINSTFYEIIGVQ